MSVGGHADGWIELKLRTIKARKYRTSVKGKLINHRYEVSQKGKLRSKRYNLSVKGKRRKARYQSTEDWKNAHRYWMRSSRNAQRLRDSRI